MSKKRILLICIGAIMMFIILCFIPVLVTRLSIVSLGVNKPNEIGDTIGGILGPVIGFVAAIAAFLAFWMQFEANQKQFLQFNKQNEDTKIERFENKFYELLKIHRENVNEFSIVRFDNPENTISGRRVFVSMLDELRFCYHITCSCCREITKRGEIEKTTFSEGEILSLAYVAYFNGVSDSSLTALDGIEDRVFFQVFEKKFEPLIKELVKDLRNYRSSFLKGDTITVNVLYPSPFGIISNQQTLKIKYVPFSGHNSRLGHYYRQLFQVVRFIIEYDDKVIKNKYDYIKTLRAQLSNYEQVLLYYNALSPFGNSWLENNFLTEWKMIKNIPLPLADFGVLPKEKLGEKDSKGNFLFEWDEIKSKVPE